ncbi:type II toxin-antitoxin system Phd/YefM family antitoxin [Planktothrix mougeotii]|uniref:Antitoxin n=1 Tax=Planktothrix mougeotii LEGE 06226 TaxID=1828728 RepID=A0ABR9UGT1_9CYAN|nr:type II toxin-antitoxin system Phd/YefM family antitoxin [Planktothrix mougeotii]MBE9145648.1 type II toxin-antitoxin system Phd/YefM family antitoxin [Planktothrix mougeotii LEGE 06226]
MKSVTPKELQGNLDNLLDEILRTGIPLEIDRGGKRLRIVPVEKLEKLQNLVYRPHVILGEPDDLIDLHWEQEVNLDLPYGNN